MKFAKFLRTLIFSEHLGWLLLYLNKLKTEFREIIYSWQINKITCLHERMFSSYTHPASGRRGGVVMTSFCPPQLRRRYVSNETTNDVSMERRQDVSVVRLCDIAQGRLSDVSKIPNHNVSSKSQLQHPMTSREHVSTTSLN